MQRARALMLAVGYLLVLAALWLAITNWMTAHLPAGSDSEAVMTDISAKASAMFVYPNALGFGVCALWIARDRSFAPLARYLAPSVAAALMTFPLTLIGAYIMEWALYLIWPRPQAVTWLILSVPAVVPGLITGQLLRWPKVESVEPLLADPHAV